MISTSNIFGFLICYCILSNRSRINGFSNLIFSYTREFNAQTTLSNFEYRHSVKIVSKRSSNVNEPISYNGNRTVENEDESLRFQNSLINLFGLSQGRQPVSYDDAQKNSNDNNLSFLSSINDEIDSPFLSEEEYLRCSKESSSEGPFLSSLSDSLTPSQITPSSTSSKDIDENFGFLSDINHRYLDSFINSIPEIPEEYLPSSIIDIDTNGYGTNDDELLLQAYTKQNQWQQQQQLKKTQESKAQDVRFNEKDSIPILNVSNTMNITQSDELHRLIFENEKGFFKQSEIFRQSLGPSLSGSPSQTATDLKTNKSMTLFPADNYDNDLTNVDPIFEANKYRRSAEYRQRRDEAIKNIQNEIKDVENTFLATEQYVHGINQSDNRNSIYRDVDNESEENLDVIKFDEKNDLNDKRWICYKCNCILNNREKMHYIQLMKIQGSGDDNIKKTISRKKIVCRDCHVESMELKNGSPFLMGRVENGKTNNNEYNNSNRRTYGKMNYQNQRRMRNIGPRTEYNPDEQNLNSEQNDMRPKNVGDISSASLSPDEWRAKFVAAQQQRTFLHKSNSKNPIRRATKNTTLTGPEINDQNNGTPPNPSSRIPPTRNNILSLPNGKQVDQSTTSNINRNHQGDLNMSELLNKISVLERQVKLYKSRAEKAEMEATKLRNTIIEMESNYSSEDND